MTTHDEKPLPVARLVPLFETDRQPYALDPAKPNGYSLGRTESCDLDTPTEVESVSRVHARFTHDGSHWRVSDLQSQWGTYLNGLRLPSNAAVPLCDGDLIRVGTLRMRFHESDAPPAQEVATDVDAGAVRVESLDAEALASAAPAEEHPDNGWLRSNSETELLRLLIHEVEQHAPNVAAFVVRCGRRRETAAVLAASERAARPRAISRSTLSAANAGSAVVAFRSLGGRDVGPARIAAVPLRLGDDVDSVLYVTSSAAEGIDAQAVNRVQRLAATAGTRLAAIKQNDLAAQMAEMERLSVRAAHEQRLLLPQREQWLAGFHCIGESRAGLHLAGDFFDLIELSGSRLGVVVGDVAGKGVVAAVLMSAAHGFLHGMMEETDGDVAKAARALNKFVAARVKDCKFLTVWLGVIDGEHRTIRYVDAGHSFGMLIDERGDPRPLKGDESGGGSGLPIGIDADEPYVAAEARYEPGSKLLVVSDGIVEQVSWPSSASQRGSDFTLEFATEVVAASTRRERGAELEGTDDVARLFRAVEVHAGQRQLADDATVVLVELA